MKRIAVVLTAVCMAASLAACGNLQNGALSNSPDLAIPPGNMAVVFNGNFTDPIGSLSTVDIENPTASVNARVTSDGSDAILRSFNNRIYVVNRYGTDTIQVVDPANFSVVADYSIGKGTNPQDIVVVSDEKAYVSRLDSQNDSTDTSDVLIVNPLTGEKIGGIDLKPFTTDDGDRLARAAQMVLVDGLLYVCIQDLPKNMLESANTNGKVAIIDTNTDKVVDADESIDGVQAIELVGRNPSDITYSPKTDKFYVADSGVFVNFVVDTTDNNGGIEVIDRQTRKSEGIKIDDADLGGGVAEVRLASDELGFTIVGSTTIASFNPTTYAIVSKEVYVTPGFYLPDFTVDSHGRLLIAEQDMNAPGLVIVDPADGTKVAGPINVGAPPSSITFVDVK